MLAQTNSGHYNYAIRSPFMVVRDAPSNPRWESFSEEDIPTYIARGSAIFTSQFAQFIHPESTYDEQTANNLHMMLDALIVAKSLGESSDSVRTLYS